MHYYLLYGENNPNCPAVVLDDDENGTDFRWETEPINCDLVKMKLMEPFSKEPEMMDFHQDRIVYFFSRKIHDVLAPLSIQGIQLLRGEILNPRNNHIYENYYYLHVLNHLGCLNKELSELKISSRTGTILSIKKMVLDEEVLSKIPLEERLVFRLEEMSSFQLFHESIIEKIKSVNPTGLRFVKVEDYHFGSAFD